MVQRGFFYQTMPYWLGVPPLHDEEDQLCNGGGRHWVKSSYAETKPDQATEDLVYLH